MSLPSLPGFTPLDVRPNLDHAPWVDLAEHKVQKGQLVRIGVLPHATANGLPALEILIALPDGTFVVGETTWRLAESAFRVLLASPMVPRQR